MHQHDSGHLRLMSSKRPGHIQRSRSGCTHGTHNRSSCTLQGGFYLIYCMVCILLSLGMWLLLRCPALCMVLSAGLIPSNACSTEQSHPLKLCSLMMMGLQVCMHLHVRGEDTSELQIQGTANASEKVQT